MKIKNIRLLGTFIGLVGLVLFGLNVSWTGAGAIILMLWGYSLEGVGK